MRENYYEGSARDLCPNVLPDYMTCQLYIQRQNLLRDSWGIVIGCVGKYTSPFTRNILLISKLETGVDKWLENVLLPA